MRTLTNVVRRSAGLLARTRADLDLGSLEDPRDPRGRRWKLASLLTALLSGLVAGCNSLTDVEMLTERMSLAVRRKLSIPRRVPDTTLRGLVMRLGLDALRGLIRRQVRQAHRRKALVPVGLPCGVVAIDGRSTKTNMADPDHAQSIKDGSYHLVRTLTSALVSSRSTVCLDAMPIPPTTNEVGCFKDAFNALLAAYGHGDLFEVVTADAGLTSKENADHVNAANLGYVFAIKDNQPALLDEAVRILGKLGPTEAAATSEQTLTKSREEVVVRRIWITTEMAGWNDWSHLRVAIRVEREVTGRHASKESRYFISNVPRHRFTDKQWLQLIRHHWRVENDCHKTWDVSMAEDDRPWLRDPYGMLVTQLLRRIAYNALALFRSVTVRAEDERGLIPWRTLMSNIRHTIEVATDLQLDGLRWVPRPGAAALGSPPPLRC